MNDPHVVALIYKIVHGPDTHYDNADPIEHETEDFSVKIKNEIVRFEMKKHCTSKEEVQKLLYEYIQAWEVSAGLDMELSAFSLEYMNVEMIDRNPVPGAPKLVHDRLELKDGLINIKRSYRHDHYPSPAPEIKITPDVRSMYGRFQGYRSGNEPLASMVYFCLTVLEYSIEGRNRRDKVAIHYNIEIDVLREIGRLSSKKGGEDARKAEGQEVEFTYQDLCFLERAINKIIRRVGEKAKNPSQKFPLISLSDLKNTEA